MALVESQLGVRDLAASVASGQSTPTEIVEAVLDRMAATEPLIHAWSYIDASRLRNDAEDLTAEAHAGRLRGPLHGVPVGVKDQFHVQGMPTRFGPRPNEAASEDATVVARLRSAGAMIVGKTHMAMDYEDVPTRNPWNLEHTPGGSSSGSGAAVAARVVPLAIGEQTYGSNLRPAAFCGIEAIKPTYGRISRHGCGPVVWSRDHPGLIGLTMPDLALVMSVVAGPDPRDPTTIGDPAMLADLEMSTYAPPRIGVVANFFPERTEPPMRSAVDRAATLLGSAGARVDSFMLVEHFGLAWSAGSLVAAEAGVITADQAPPGGRGSAWWDPMSLIPTSYYLQARRARTWLSGLVQRQMTEAGIDALLMGAAPGPAPVGLDGTGDPVLLDPWTFLGFPAITVNGGLTQDGLPLGLQFVGRPRDDYALLRLGAWCSDVLGRLPAPGLARVARGDLFAGEPRK
jgi:Asp-tRNA(Asn)/Glu-tRNA(Gln) amidotransferase A subunit family amidase